MKIAELREEFGSKWRIYRYTYPTIARNVYLFCAERACGDTLKARNLTELSRLLHGENHTPECWAEITAHWDTADKWVQDHPNYCRNCGGGGGFVSSYDPSPAGISLAPGSMQEFDYCGECVEQGNCPECGQKMFDPNEYDWSEPIICPHCGWKEEETTGMPQGYQDFCRCEAEKQEAYYLELNKKGGY